MKTIHECCTKDKTPLYYAETTVKAIDWLEKIGGGIYHNTLHNLEVPISGKKNDSKRKRTQVPC